MRRVLALVVSAGLVVGALWIHGDLDTATTGSDGGGATPRLLCAEELGAVCAALENAGVEIDVQPPSAVVAQLSSLSDDDARHPTFDGWLSPSPSPEIVREARARNQAAPLVGKPDRIASSPLVLAIRKERQAVLARRCGTVDWKCIGENAGRQWSDIGGQAAWGTLKPGHLNPEMNAVGLDIIGQAAAEYFGKSDLSTDDYDDEGFFEWFTRLERAVRPSFGATPLEQMLASAAAFDMVGATEAEAGPTLARASRDRRDDIAVTYPAPVARVDVVFVPAIASDRAGDLRDIVTGSDGREALARNGWRVPGESPARGVPSKPPLPDQTNLPGPGSLEALLETWREVTG
jgi:hypothetical protein